MQQYGMTKQQHENKAFVRNLIVEVEAAAVVGITTPHTIADHFNANGVTSRKGRRWTGTNVAKFLNSPGVKRSLLVEK